MDNYKSSTDPSVSNKVEKAILNELELGHYVIVNEKPPVVSALGAVPKPDSEDVCLIHDCSMPKGEGFNSYSKVNSFKFQTLDDAIKLLKPGYFMSKIDLKSTYRSVPIHPSNYAGTGLKWRFKGGKVKFTYFVDTRLPFGGKRSPEILNRLTQAVRGIMAKKGFEAIVVYLDDVLVIGESMEACQAAFDSLLSLLQNLGFRINWQKVVYPTQRLVFLGVLLDTVQCSMSLPEIKLMALKSYLLEFSLRHRASKRQLQVLAGKLNWACRVVYGGWTFLRRILDLMNRLNSPNAKLRLNAEFYADLSWWISFLALFNGKCLFLDRIPTTDVQADACAFGAGAFFRGDWAYHSFVMDNPAVRDLHINYKEVLAVVLAAKQWRSKWCNQHVIIYSDSTTAVGIINKGTCRNPIIMHYLRELFWLSAIYNFGITASHIPGIENAIADAISRLHDSEFLFKACKYFAHLSHGNVFFLSHPLVCHMSVLSYYFLLFRYWGPLLS